MELIKADADVLVIQLLQVNRICGVVEGTHYDTDGIKKIATIPSRDELISKFLGSIQSPITNFARVIKQIAESKEA